MAVVDNVKFSHVSITGLIICTSFSSYFSIHEMMCFIIFIGCVMEGSIAFCFSVICFVLKSYQSLANNRVVWVIQFYYGRLTPQQCVAIIQLLSKSVIRYANTKRITVNSLAPLLPSPNSTRHFPSGILEK